MSTSKKIARAYGVFVARGEKVTVQADRARVRAEATSDTLREVLDSLRDGNREAGPADKS